MSASTRPRLTPHQRGALRRLVQLHDRLGRPVRSDEIGLPAAMGHLVAKGYAREDEPLVGPRGGLTPRFTPLVRP